MKTVVITGHTSGIGQACYNWFAELNEHHRIGDTLWSVIGVSKSHFPDHLRNNSVLFRHFQYDLANREERWNLVCGVDEILSKDRLSIDVLINNAGVFELEETYPESFDRLVATNMEAPYYLCREFYNRGLFTEGSVIVNVASISGINGEPDNPIYAMTKAALINMTKSLAKAWAKDKIRVLSISPGYVKTNLCPGELPSELLENIPLKREAEAYEVANVIYYSAVFCPYITGSNIVIDGGLTC